MQETKTKQKFIPNNQRLLRTDPIWKNRLKRFQKIIHCITDSLVIVTINHETVEGHDRVSSLVFRYIHSRLSKTNSQFKTWRLVTSRFDRYEAPMDRIVVLCTATCVTE